jgi:hypothetical protein
MYRLGGFAGFDFQPSPSGRSINTPDLSSEEMVLTLAGRSDGRKSKRLTRGKFF